MNIYLERLRARSTEVPSGCRVWTGPLDRDGYGSMHFQGKYQYVHRVVWQIEHGPIPPGMEIDHVRDRGCRYRNCVNIDHLEVVTHRVNTLRSAAPSAINASKTHCCNGHPFDAANTYWRLGKRSCRACNCAAVLRLRARKRAETQP